MGLAQVARLVPVCKINCYYIPEKFTTYIYLSVIFLSIHLQPWRAFEASIVVHITPNHTLIAKNGSNRICSGLRLHVFILISRTARCEAPASYRNNYEYILVNTQENLVHIPYCSNSSQWALILTLELLVLVICLANVPLIFPHTGCKRQLPRLCNRPLKRITMVPSTHYRTQYY